ncbi:MAG: flagellar M-ring protein FliF, partial [Deltaproteobacteria bacterium]|nr:flagellar M-ring protein FliF [Deltaproteobacteria bacterium]
MADASPQGPKQVVAQLAQLWGRQPKRRKIVAIGLVAAIALLIAATSLSKKTEAWGVVADGASPDDAQELLSALQARAVPARLREGKVEVMSDRVDEARAIAAAAGLPRTGKGFELFDGSSLGQSSFSEQVNYRRALQGELARSITALAQVQGARVHLALGKRSVFKDQNEPASASVALHLHAGQTLSAEQVRGVRQLVAASTEGLRPDGVVVVDNHGNLLDAAETGSSDRRAEIERTLAARVRAMLERVVGPGKVSVVATAVVDDRKVSETQELY